MSKSEMDYLRASIDLDGYSRVRVVYTEDYFTGRRAAALECVNCEHGLVVRQDKGWFECPSCTYELKPSEVRELLLEHIRLLDGLARGMGLELVGDLVLEVAKEKGSAAFDRAKGAIRDLVGGRKGK